MLGRWRHPTTVKRLSKRPLSHSRRHKGSLFFNLDDHPSMRFAVNLEFNLFVLLGAEKRRARRVLCGDDTQIRVVLVAR